MVCVNELQRLKCNKSEVLRELAIVISPYAPFITEELWSKLGEKESITKASYPEFKSFYLVENSYTYPVSFNGKMRFKIDFPVNMDKAEIEKQVLKHKDAQKWLEGKIPKKVIVVPKKIVNVVL